MDTQLILTALSSLAWVGTIVTLVVKSYIKNKNERDMFDRSQMFTKEDWYKEREAMKSEHRAEMKDIKEEHRREMKELNEQHEVKVKQIVQTHIAEREKDKIRIQELETRVTTLEDENRALIDRTLTK